MCLWPTGQAQTLETVNQVIKQEFSDYSYGRDYVMLGFRPGGQGGLRAPGSARGGAFRGLKGGRGGG